MYLFGASGHGKVVKEILEAQLQQVIAFIDDSLNVYKWCGKDVLHDAVGLSPMIVCIGDNFSRKKVVERLQCNFGVAVHPNAVISPSATIGEGTVVMAGVVINAGVVIGEHCIINTGATIDHDCVIGDFCHIAPGAHICGSTRIGEGTWIGVGTSVIQCLNIGDWCMIGAGSVVVTDIPENVTAFGNPCKVKKRVSNLK